MIYPLRWQNVIKKQVTMDALFLNGSCHVCLGHVGKSEKLARLTFAKQQDAIEWLTSRKNDRWKGYNGCSSNICGKNSCYC